MAPRVSCALLCLGVLASLFAPNSGTGMAGHNDVTRRKRSDDVSARTLEQVVQEQARTVQRILSELAAMKTDQTATKNELIATKNELTATKNELTATKNELAATNTLLTSMNQSAKSEPVAFTVRFSHDDNTKGLPMSTHSVLQFDRAITNLGHGYNTSTGIFTAPQAGTYCFFLTMTAVQGGGGCGVVLVREGSFLGHVYARGQQDLSQGFTALTVPLASGERVWVRQKIGDALRGGSSTIFTGFLLHSD